MLLEAKSISKAFGGVQALADVSLELRAGEVHALVGENGAGKSTLIKVITGAHRPDCGELHLGERLLEPLDPLAARRLGIAAIYQQPALFPDLTVAENIAIAAEPMGIRRVSWRQRRARAADLLGRLGAAISPDAVVSQLTMPEQQLVEIARAIGERTRVLIMDEPTASLGQRDTERLFEIIADLKHAGTGIIYVSHRLDEIFQIADRVTVLRDGRHVATQPTAELTKGQLVRRMVGRELDAVTPKRDIAVGDVTIGLKNVSCAATGVHGVDLEVRAGEIVGLAGLVGAGRTELARIVFGLTPASGGRIVLGGREVKVVSPQDAIAAGIAYVPEDRRRHGVILDLDVAANISLASLERHSNGARLDLKSERQLARQMVAQLGVKTPSIDARARQLSGGNQQKVALARWLATRPRVLILDEPTQGVDIGAKAEIHRIMGELAASGMAILLISSDMPELLGLADRIAVMRGGTIVAGFRRDDVTAEQVLAAALGQRAA